MIAVEMGGKGKKKTKKTKKVFNGAAANILIEIVPNNVQWYICHPTLFTIV